MTNPIWQVGISPQPFAFEPPRFSESAGGVVEFWGVVRAREGEERIAGIDYEAHVEMARRQLETLATETVERFPLLDLCVRHRTGFVPVAEPSLYVRASAAHRQAAFEAAQWLIDELKRRVPVWKHPREV